MYIGLERHILPDSRHVLPWHDRLLWDGLCDAADSDYRPDVLDCLASYRFGFASLNQARYWLYNPAWLATLDTLGYMARTYLCSPQDVILGHAQVVFCAGELIREEAVLILA